jgi:ribonucleotide monophosphatase NagD (HAD superfamily)
MIKKLRRLPGILSDIDGVIYRGGKRIDGAERVLNSVLNPLKDGSLMPFTLLTNGGGTSEKVRSKYINKVVFGEDAP